MILFALEYQVRLVIVKFISAFPLVLIRSASFFYRSPLRSKIACVRSLRCS